MFNLGQQQFFVDIYKKLSKAGLYQIIIVYEDIYNDERIDPNFKNILFLTHEEYSRIKVDLALHSEIHCHSRFAKSRVFVGHGFPGKHTLWEKKLLLNQDHYFMYGPRDRDILAYIEKNNPGSTNHLRLWEIGYPKYDQQSSINIEIIKYENQIFDSQRLNILYAPAWDPGCSLRVYRDEIFKIFSSCADYNFIVKLHPAMLVPRRNPEWQWYTGGVEWEVFVKDKCSNLDNVHFYEEISINSLYEVCDIMVTDFSGVALAFLINQKPVVCIDMFKHYAPYLESLGSDPQESVNNPLFNNGREASYIVEHPRELPNQLLKIKDNDHLLQKRQGYAEYMLYNRNKSVEAMSSAIHSIIFDSQ